MFVSEGLFPFQLHHLLAKCSQPPRTKFKILKSDSALIDTEN